MKSYYWPDLCEREGLGSVRCVWLDKIPDLFLCYVLLVCYCSLYLSLESFKYELSREHNGLILTTCMNR